MRQAPFALRFTHGITESYFLKKKIKNIRKCTQCAHTQRELHQLQCIRRMRAKRILQNSSAIVDHLRAALPKTARDERNRLGFGVGGVKNITVKAARIRA